MPKPVTTALPETQILPDPSLEKRSRRIFTLAYKLRILAEADACKRGELGRLLRREKLYNSQLQEWRREQAEQGDAGLAKSAPGLKASHTAQDRLIEQPNRDIHPSPPKTATLVAHRVKSDGMGSLAPSLPAPPEICPDRRMCVGLGALRH